MNAINFEYSQKNIPTLSRHNYFKSLKVESFLRKTRWKATTIMN